MEQPTDSTCIQLKPNHVALVVKSIYGHKAAGSIWGSVIHDTVWTRSFEQSRVDNRMHIIRTATCYPLLRIVVDDMILASTSRQLPEDIKRRLRVVFKIKLLGSLRSFIGWPLLRTPSGIYVSQCQ